MRTDSHRQTEVTKATAAIRNFGNVPKKHRNPSPEISRCSPNRTVNGKKRTPPEIPDKSVQHLEKYKYLRAKPAHRSYNDTKIINCGNAF